VSIGCDTYAFTGGAHGTKGYVAINLELPSLRRLTLDDFVRRDPKSRAKLRELANASSSFEGFDDVKLDTFVVTDAGLRFELKDQLPFAVADAIEPQVSWSALSPILVRPWTPSAAHASAAAPHTVWDARADADL
jgi:hypothetical protein